MQQYSSDLRKAYKTTAIIGLAMMASLFIYYVVVENIKQQYAPFSGFAPLPHDTASTMRYALLGVTTLEFFLIRFLNAQILSAKARVRNTSATGSYSPEIQRLITAAVIAFALCESVAIYGLVLFLIQGDAGDFYLFLLISLFYFSVFFPKYSAWEAWMKEREKASRAGTKK